MEFDPLTGQTREWWRSTPATCGGIGGFAVPPGGGYMRAIDGPTPQIVNIRSEDDFEPFFLDSSVVSAMVDSTFAPNGDYYVSTPARSVVRFAAGGSPSEILAQDWPDDLRDWGFIAPAPQGGVFYGETYGSLLQHVDDDGTVTTVTDMPLSMGLISDMVATTNGDLFLLTSSGLFRMARDLPGVISEVHRFPVFSGKMGIDPVREVLIVHDGLGDPNLGGDSVFEVRLSNYEMTRIGTLPFAPNGYVGPSGITIYVPEPVSCWTLLVTVLAARRFRCH